MPNLIRLHIQSFVLSLMRKTALRFEDIEISYLKLSITLGETLTDHFIQISQLKDFVKLGCYRLKQLDLYKTLLISLLNQDYDQSWFILKSYLGFLHTDQDLFIAIIRLKLKNLVLK